MLSATRVVLAASAYILLSCVGHAVAQNSTLVGATISNGYTPPTSKVGINDTIYGAASQIPSRYARFASIGTKTKIYNLYWSTFESSSVASSTSASLSCPSGYSRVPQDAAELAAKGYNRYRCFNDAHIGVVDALIDADADNGFESAAVLYSTPIAYRDTACDAAVASYPNDLLIDGCVPRDDAMDDYEDFVNFVASRYDGTNGVGKITHFIVWNEFQSGKWFNYHPAVPWNAGSGASGYVSTLVAKYVSLLSRTHEAIQRHASPALMYVSLDPIIGGSNATSGLYHADTEDLLDGLWASLGIATDWSIAIHPYFPPTTVDSNLLNFGNLTTLLNYQVGKLTGSPYSVSNPLNRPQAILFASEQGWESTSYTSYERATFVCQAHSIAMTLPTLTAMTHNSFQESHPDTDPLGLIPYEAGATLGDLDTLNPYEWQAYQATAPSNWGRTNSHGCCQALGLGCIAPLRGAVDGVALESSTYTLRGWACSEGSSASLSVYLYGYGPAGGGGVYAGEFQATWESEPAVSASCKSSGKAFRYRIDLTPFLAYHGAPLYVYAISPYGAAPALLPGSGSHVIP